MKRSVTKKAAKVAEPEKPSISVDEVERLAKIGMRKEDVKKLSGLKKFSAAQDEAFARGVAKGRASILGVLYDAATKADVAKDAIAAIKTYLAECAKHQRDDDASGDGEIDVSAGAGIGGVSLQHLTKSKRDRLMAASAQAHLAKLYGAPDKTKPKGKRLQ